MRYPNYGIPEEIESQAKRLLQLAGQIRENDELIEKLLAGKHAEARLKAEARVAELEKELKTVQDSAGDLNQRIHGQATRFHAIRVALNGEGRNPLEDHAHAVFQALKAAAPEHPLVTRVSGDKPESASLSRTDLRFIYACLDAAREKLSHMGCNDWPVSKPDRSTLWFMQQVEDHSRADIDAPSEKIVVGKDGIADGPANWAVPLYLMSLMEKIYGKDTFKGAKADEMGLL